MNENFGNSTSSRLLLTDSNLLLLLTVGAFDQRLITSFKRLGDFSVDDFYLLRDFSSAYRIIATPHVLTEVSNLANSLSEKTKAQFFPYLATVIRAISEHTEASATIVLDDAFIPFGLTDAALCRVAPSGLILTQDSRLRSYLQRRGRLAMGIDDVKQLRANANGRRPRRVRTRGPNLN